MSLAAWLENRLAVSSAFEPKRAATYQHSIRGGVHVWMTLEMLSEDSKVALSQVYPQWPQTVTISLIIYLLVCILFNKPRCQTHFAYLNIKFICKLYIKNNLSYGTIWKIIVLFDLIISCLLLVIPILTFSFTQSQMGYFNRLLNLKFYKQTF